MSNKIKLPILLTLALLVILAMLRLAFWQLERAEQKQRLLDQVVSRANLPVEPLYAVLGDVPDSSSDRLRYRNVHVSGQYLSEHTVFIDNQVFDGQVGYRVFTPFRQAQNEQVVVVDRGWVSVGSSREALPEVTTPQGIVVIAGRLNNPPAQPPLWNEDYPIAQGQVWAYLPLKQYAEQINMQLLPLVLELAPQNDISIAQPSGHADQFKRRFSQINDEWVAKHQGYAFQWFAMAVAFFIACLLVLMKWRGERATSD